MGNTASKLKEWITSRISLNGLHNIHSPSHEKKTRPLVPASSEGYQIRVEGNDDCLANEKSPGNSETLRYTIPENLNSLLSLITKDQLKNVQENKRLMGIKDKKDSEYNMEYPKITSGTIAEDFQIYLKKYHPENNIKLSFLIITELVLASKDEELFHHLASVFLDRLDDKYNVDLRNRHTQDTLFQYLTTKSLKFEECLNLLKKNGKFDQGMVSRNDGIHSVYKEFREFKIKENSKKYACLLSIL